MFSVTLDLVFSIFDLLKSKSIIYFQLLIYNLCDLHTYNDHKVQVRKFTFLQYIVIHQLTFSVCFQYIVERKHFFYVIVLWQRVSITAMYSQLLSSSPTHIHNFHFAKNERMDTVGEFT